MVRWRVAAVSYLYPSVQPTNGYLHRMTICKRRYCNISPLSSGSALDSISQSTHLEVAPPPEDYGRNVFADKCTISVTAGGGGHGCVSFLREKFVAAGPPNGGDGGSGGSIYIQAVREEMSLHKLARRRFVKAGRGANGKGKSRGGKRGADVLLQVPIGTVVREISRHDPLVEDEKRRLYEVNPPEAAAEDMQRSWTRDKWIVHPSIKPSAFTRSGFPALPRPRKSALTMAQPDFPIYLDLSQPMDKPMLLVAGAVGGAGNPHFVTAANLRPKIATKGDAALSLALQLELKLLADVGFVGMPNAGKSTLLRALSRSRARIGNWAFTTLQPNIGTVVLDDGKGRPRINSYTGKGEVRTQISIADIPGLIPGAHQDKGLGHGFLRHVERARVLAFVIDLSAGDAVEALDRLWYELQEFESAKELELNRDDGGKIVDWKAFGSSLLSISANENLGSNDEQGRIVKSTSPKSLPSIPSASVFVKPWFVIATKADLDGTRDNFARLQVYLEAITQDRIAHPGVEKSPWRGQLIAMPVSAMRGEGLDRIPEWIIELLNNS